jgi:hypothetical protein
MPALAAIPYSLQKYGHCDVEVVFTDSPHADKWELERVFPSLHHNVQPVLLASSLKVLKVADDWKYTILDTVYQINNHINLLMEQVSQAPSSKSLYFAMDMEWSVDHMTGIYGRVSFLAITYEKVVYLIHVYLPLFFLLQIIKLPNFGSSAHEASPK